MTDNDDCPRDDGGYLPGGEVIGFPALIPKRKPIDPSEPGTNLREMGTAESFEGIGINMLCAGILFLLERFGPERTQELMAHSYAETRRRHMTKAAN
jgi:hypothetical protein